MDQRRSISAFRRCGCTGSAWGFERGHDKAVLAVGPKADLRVVRQADIQPAQRLFHRLLQVADELACIHGLLQRRVIGVAPGVEIRRQIVVGVAEPIGPLDPDLLAPEAVAKRLQHADLVVDAVDALRPARRLFDENLLHLGTNDVVDRHLVAGNELLPAVAVSLKPGQGLGDGPMRHVVGAKRQRLEQQGQHLAVMMAVGTAKHGVNAPLIRRTLGVVLPGEGPQDSFVDDREEHLADHSVRLFHSGLGKAEQDQGLAMDLLEATDDLRDHLALGVDRCAMDDLNQQLDQAVDDGPAPLPAKGGEQRVANRAGMGTQLVDRFGGYPQAVAFQNLWRHVAEQRVWQLHVAYALELGDFCPQTGEACAAWVGFEPAKGDEVR